MKARGAIEGYTEERLRRMFARFEDVTVVKRQLMPEELPVSLRWMGADRLGRHMGWNLVVKGRKPRRA